MSLNAAAVTQMQKALGVPADGEIGPQTRAALRAYERAHGLPADGQPDTATLKALGVDPQAAAPGSASTTTPAGAGVQAAVAAALGKAGAPYRSGATGPSSFDCSGLVVGRRSRPGSTFRLLCAIR